MYSHSTNLLSSSHAKRLYTQSDKRGTLGYSHVFALPLKVYLKELIVVFEYMLREKTQCKTQRCSAIVVEGFVPFLKLFSCTDFNSFFCFHYCNNHIKQYKTQKFYQKKNRVFRTFQNSESETHAKNRYELPQAIEIEILQYFLCFVINNLFNKEYCFMKIMLLLI